MYSKLKNVQILIALLKKFNIRHAVLSAGTKHVPIAHSMENDDFFKCYSVVDERSAGYFALGLAKELGEPVILACTSSTATCNYLPAITEAYYQKIPLVVITGDRNPHFLGQLEDQMIRQPGMYNYVVKKSVDIPMVDDNDCDSFWYCQRLVNEALLELSHHGFGPVHINIRIIASLSDTADASIKKLPNVTAIRRLSYETKQDIWKEKVEVLKKAKRILIVCGMKYHITQEELEDISKFAKMYNCALLVEHMSNIKIDESLETYVVSQVIGNEAFDDLMPDIVITIGENFISNFKYVLRRKANKFEHWVINDDGNVMDVFKSLTTIFECSTKYFFKYFVNATSNISNDMNYYNKWKKYINSIKFSNTPYSNMYAIESLSKTIPNNSILHLGILNSTRIMQHYKLDKSIRVYSNIGTDGIDGSMSTFIGCANATNKQCYLVLGDLSFFYDMNSLMIRHKKENMKIMLLNNGGAAEFHYTMGKDKIPTINQHIAAEHNSSAKMWVESQGYEYLCAKNKEEFDEKLKLFVSNETKKPVVFEVFTNKETDASILRKFYNENSILTPIEKAKKAIKNILRR